MTKPILLVEDEEHDILFMQMALQKAGVNNYLALARDGKEAIQYLAGTGKYHDRTLHPLPGLVLLDLKLPEIPGLEVLRWIRERPQFSTTPVIVFSSSNQDFDVDSAYQLGANAYVIKPGYMELLEIVRCIKIYWLDMDAPPLDCPEWLSIIVPPERNL